MVKRRRQRRASARGENKNLTYSLDFSCWLASSLLGSSSMYLLTYNRKPTKAGNRVLSPRERAITSPPVRIIFHQLLTIIYLLCIGILQGNSSIESLYRKSFLYLYINTHIDRQGPCPIIYFTEMIFLVHKEQMIQRGSSSNWYIEKNIYLLAKCIGIYLCRGIIFFYSDPNVHLVTYLTQLLLQQ